MNIIKEMTNVIMNIGNKKDKQPRWNQEKCNVLAQQLADDYWGEYRREVSFEEVAEYIRKRTQELPEDVWEIWSEWDISHAIGFYGRYWRCRLNGHIHHITSVNEFLQYLGAPGCTPIAEECDCWYHYIFGIKSINSSSNC